MIGEHAPDSAVALVASATIPPGPDDDGEWFRLARNITDTVWRQAWADGHQHGRYDPSTSPPAAL